MRPASILIDTNVPIYASGSGHPLREPCRQVLRLSSRFPGTFFTDAEVFQELLHRYLSLRRWTEGREVLAAFSDLMRDRVAAVTIADLESAAESASAHPGADARDLLHVAVMTRLGSSSIVSADRHFDRFEGIVRLDPGNVAAWERQLL